MYRYAVINEQTKIVSNVVIWDGSTEWKAPDGHYLIRHEECDINDIHEEIDGIQTFMKVPELEQK